VNKIKNTFLVLCGLGVILVIFETLTGIRVPLMMEFFDAVPVLNFIVAVIGIGGLFVAILFLAFEVFGARGR
jgi:hypothetical protein